VDLLPQDCQPEKSLPVNGVAVPISALTGQGVESLLLAVEAVMEQQFQPVTVMLPYNRGDLMSLFHERGQVNEERHLPEGTEISGRIPHRLISLFDNYLRVKDTTG
jgi:GTP-binding protein HflX